MRANHFSQARLLRRSLRLPRPLLGTPLSPLLPHATPTLPPPLPPRPVLRSPLLLRGVRLRHVPTATKDEGPDRSCHLDIGRLVIQSFQPAHLCEPVDEGEM